LDEFIHLSNWYKPPAGDQAASCKASQGFYIPAIDVIALGYKN